MENKIKNLKKECPICGAVIDAGLDYCPKCDSYVGDIVPLDDQENDQKISSEGSSSEGDFGSNSSTNKGFEELDTILSDSQESQSKITIHELQQLLASNGQTVDNSVEPLTSTSQKKEEIDSNQNYAGDTGRPPKRNELRKKKKGPSF
ncbi:hypothetical protein [Xylocopilactobacillus apis]|uniref:Zinc ribbon domain-containing protein n=1 Tax=Xylocopilactobacillus apis TaxID=2932183 RepID=A0AAU9CXP3_9LACO|nr:hypothetical protein [Xylocopilactobacillus apis]BDR56038.1 hypothetical protein KIMC2_06000 [Xylocopilactobacillus apis]